LLFPRNLSNSNVKAVALTREPENVDDIEHISLETTFTINQAGRIDMFFFRSFFVISGVVRVNVAFAESLSSLKYFL